MVGFGRGVRGEGGMIVAFATGLVKDSRALSRAQTSVVAQCRRSIDASAHGPARGVQHASRSG